MTTRQIAQICSILLCLVALVWLIYQPGFEPIATLIAGIIGVIASFDKSFAWANIWFIGEAHSQSIITKDGESKTVRLKGAGGGRAGGSEFASATIGNGVVEANSDDSEPDSDKDSLGQELTRK